MNVAEKITALILAYSKIAKLDPKSWDGAKQIETLNESWELDPTGITTAILLRGFVDNFTDNATFSAKRIICEPKAFDREIGQIRSLLAQAEDTDLIGIQEEFKERCSYLGKRLKAKDGKAFTDLLANKYDLALIRRDALRSIERLEAHQFLQGKPDSAELRVNDILFEFWNINSLVAALRDQNIDGISLCLLRDPEETLHSYFVFAVKNGETITILTDREEGPHPAYNRMSRRPDRQLERRAAKNWFPYHVLDLTAIKDEFGRTKQLYANQRAALVKYNCQAIKLKPIGELYAEEILWFGLVADMINERYGKQHKLLPEVSYTGEMVSLPHALVGADGALVKEGQYKPLMVESIKASDVTTQSTAEQWEQEPTGFNAWMEERYGNQVPNSVLNLVGEHSAVKLLASGQSVSIVELPDDKDYPYARREKRQQLETLNPITFGSKEKLEHDRMWVARCNQMKVIQAAAEREYMDSKEALLSFVNDKVRANIASIFKACATAEWMLPDYDWTFSFNGSYQKAEPRNIVAQNDDPFGTWGGSGTIFLGEYDRDRYPHYRCFVNDGAASIFTRITTSCPQDLATILGLPIEQLPVGLQHWYKQEPYSGNHILNRLDPQDWVLENPWMRLKFVIKIALSKRGLNQIRRDNNLPSHGEEYWKKIHLDKKL